MQLLQQSPVVYFAWQHQFLCHQLFCLANYFSYLRRSYYSNVLHSTIGMLCLLHILTIIKCCFIIHIANASDETEVKTFEINFSAYDDVSDAFAELFTVCQKAVKISSEEFRTVRNLCVA